MLFSNNRLLPANIEVDRGLREDVASSTARNVAFFAEFLDQPAFSGQVYEQTVISYLHDKYLARPPATIVVTGEFALEFLLRNRARLFPDVPLVFVPVDRSFAQSIQPLPADVVVVPVEYDYLGTIQLALRLHPHTRRLVVVTGTSDWDRNWESDLRVGLARLKVAPTVEFIAGLSTDAVVKRLSELGHGDVVFTPGYFRDGADQIFAPRDSVALMVAASGAPIYGPFSTFIGAGIVGGRMPTYIDMGRQAARFVNSLLDGAPPATLRLPASIPAQVQIDWRQVQKWNIAVDDISDDAIVYFREPTFWEAHRIQAVIIVAVILLQAALIAALLVERRLRQRTASALEETEKRMTLATQAARLSTWMWEIARDRIWIFPASQQPGGRSGESPATQEDALKTVHPADRAEVERAIRQTVAENAELYIEYRVVDPNGDVRWIAARGRPEKGHKQRILGVAADVTERKVAELQAAKDRAELQHLTRVSLLGQLSASIAHQLNQPLSAILGNAEAAQKMLGRDKVDLAELREICNDIVSEDHRASQVIRRLGDLYKRGGAKMEPVDLNELVGETLDLVRNELLTRNITVATEFASVLPTIEGGRVQLQQVLLNLILNAAEAMSETVMEQRKVTIRTHVTPTVVKLYVVDHGPGIAADGLRHLFDAFWTTKAGGMGMGLALCQSIVAAHRGSITAANNVDGGATFCVALPIRQNP